MASFRLLLRPSLHSHGLGRGHTACASGREISIGLLVGCDLDDSVLGETQLLLGKGERAVESRFGGHCLGSTPVCPNT